MSGTWIKFSLRFVSFACPYRNSTDEYSGRYAPFALVSLVPPNDQLLARGRFFDVQVKAK